MKSSFFSIIIPAFNAEKTISKSLDSIIAQTFKEIEVVCVDGGSTDNTLEIIKEYSQKNKFISFISEKDSGIYDAMNKGIRLAKGKWIYFFGSDDSFFNKTVLADIYDAAKKFNGSVIYGNVYSTVYGKKYDGEFDKQKILSGNIAHQAIFYNKKLFAKIGDYNLKYRILADWEYNLRWMNNSRIKRKYVDLTVANYAAGGKSDNVYDQPFYTDFQYLIEKYGYRKKSLKQKIRALIKKMIGI
jgi:glycosyltransferase involved in cell wall biosynthesis